MTTSWPRHGSGQRLDVLDITAYNAESRIAQVLLIVPFTTGGEVVVQGHGRHRVIGQQTVGKVAADEPGAADNEVTFGITHFEVSALSCCRPADSERIQAELVGETSDVAGTEAGANKYGPEILHIVIGLVVVHLILRA